MPPLATAGNVLRPSTSARFSMRLCPTFDPLVAKEIMLKKLTENIPYNAKVTVTVPNQGSGWCMKEL